jgi:anti-sigma-K factor RskA
VATVDAKRGTIAVVPAAFSADATVPELWLIPSDGKPRPLGILRADRTVTIAVPADLAA